MGCDDYEDNGAYHAVDLCDSRYEDVPAYAVTYRGSLIPEPASQQVAVYQIDGAWFVGISGYSWRPGQPVVTLRHERPISAEDAVELTALLSAPTFERLDELGYYGSTGLICMDGASLRISSRTDGAVTTVGQHTCAGKTEFSQIAGRFRETALRYAPEFANLLDGLID